MSTFLSIIGAITCVLTITVFLIMTSGYRNDDKFFSIRFLGFGIIKPKEDHALKMFNHFRKTHNKKVFIDSPQWFNKYIYNFGVRK